MEAHRLLDLFCKVSLDTPGSETQHSSGMKLLKALIRMGPRGWYQNPYNQNPYNHNPYSLESKKTQLKSLRTQLKSLLSQLKSLRTQLKSLQRLSKSQLKVQNPYGLNGVQIAKFKIPTI